MPQKEPSPQTTLVVLLGASEWPRFPEFQSSKAFANSASQLKAYLLSPHQFGLPAENLLDLFDADQSADDIDSAICDFLDQCTTRMKASGNAARDLLVYYVGHGGFVGPQADYYLAICRTRSDNPRASSIGIASLADTLKEKARRLRRILILDCCFAAAAFQSFQSGPAQVAIQQAVSAFKEKGEGVGYPERGTALLCSSGPKVPSLISRDGIHTIFTEAFLWALTTGNPRQQNKSYLSLRELTALTADLLADSPERNAPRPYLHSPDQGEGDVADIPFFPNLAARVEKQHRLLPGTELSAGRYEIEKLVAVGDMTAVYRAIDTHFSRPCAVKEMLDDFQNDTDHIRAVEWFKRETKLLVKLNHPYVCRVFDFFVENGRYHLIMDWIEGSSLTGVLEKEGHVLGVNGARGVPEARARSWTEQVCNVLSYLHRQSIIFRDLKPSNIMITDRDEVRLIDFGIVHTLQSQRHPTIIMTLGYVAPEQLQGRPEPRSDLYALGATIHRVLTHHNAADNKPTIFSFPPIRTLRPDISPAFEQIVMKALAPAPEQRWNSAAEMERAIKQIEGTFAS